MKKAITTIFFASLVSESPPSQSAQATAPQIDRAVLERYQSLPPAQRSSLLESYGIQSQGSGARYELASPGNILEQRDPRVESQLDEQFLIEYLKFLEFRDSEAEVSEKALEKYGVSFFDEDYTTFANVDSHPLPERYVLGVGDSLAISRIGIEEGEDTLQVQRDGSIIIPKIGQLELAGMTFADAKVLIENEISKRLLGTKAFVSLGKMKNINVFVSGEVKRPGSYSVSGGTTLTQALYLSGGISDIGSLRKIELKRKGKTVLSFDLYDLLLNGDRANDQQLRSGDVVFVGTQQSEVFVIGAVRRPAIYETKPGERISDLLLMAGGVRSNGYVKKATLRRAGELSGQPSIANLDLSEQENTRLFVKDGDVLTIPSMTETVINPVMVEGAVVRPGIFAWEKGMRVSNFLASIGEDLLPVADLDVGLVVRRKNTRLDIEILAFSPLQSVQAPGSAADTEIQPHDRIVVFPLPGVDELDKSEETNREMDESPELPTKRDLLEPIIKRLKTQATSLERARTVSVEGAVREPGEYPLLADNDLNFMIALAGGLQDGASRKNIEIRRLLIGESDSVITEFLQVDLDDKSKPIELASRDVIRVNYVPDWNVDETVVVSGEVLFPGTYTISRGETLGSVLRRAGGVTERAHPEGLKYYSEETKELQLARSREILLRAEREQSSRQSVGMDSVGGYLSEKIMLELENSIRGRLVVDGPAILRGDESADIVLQAGDTIEVPVFVEAVTVVGEVFEPGAFRYEEAARFEDYISRAAGTTPRARKRSAYVIYPNGGVVNLQRGWARRLLFFTDGKKNQIVPGATIVVPTDLDYEPRLAKYRTVTNVVFESVASVAALLSLSNR
mgnify:CR=1 FL=1